MFRMNKQTKDLLEGRSLNKRELAAAKRQLVYKYILEHPDVGSNVELATAAGYNMNVVMSNEYLAGMSFISNMIRKGYIEKENTHGMTCFYIGSREEVTCVESIHKHSTAEAVEEAKKILEEEMDEYEEDEIGPEGQSKEDWATDDPIDEDFSQSTGYFGEITINSPSGSNSISISFTNKTQDEIVEMINKLNLEVL